MTNKVLISLVLILVIIIVTLLILIWTNPEYDYIYGSILGFCALFLTGVISYKIKTEHTCKCGKGECEKCGGIDKKKITDEIKKNIKELISEMAKNPNERNANELNAIFNKMGWTQFCKENQNTTPYDQQDADEFTKHLFIFNLQNMQQLISLDNDEKESIITNDDINKLLKANPNDNILLMYQNQEKPSVIVKLDKELYTNLLNLINKNKDLNNNIKKYIKLLNNNAKNNQQIIDRTKNLIIKSLFDSKLTIQSMPLRDYIIKKYTENFQNFEQSLPKKYKDELLNIQYQKIFNLIINQLIDIKTLYELNENNDYFYLTIPQELQKYTAKDKIKKILNDYIVLIPEFRDNFELLGINLHSGIIGTSSNGHYKTLVIRRDESNKLIPWLCDDITGNQISINTQINLSDSLNKIELFDYIDKDDNYNIKMLLFKKKTKLYKSGKPEILYYDRNSCYVNSSLQLLLATDLLDDNNTQEKADQKTKVDAELKINNEKYKKLTEEYNNLNKNYLLNTDLINDNKIEDKFKQQYNNLVNSVKQEYNKINELSDIDKKIKILESIINKEYNKQFNNIMRIANTEADKKAKEEASQKAKAKTEADEKRKQTVYNLTVNINKIINNINENDNKIVERRNKLPLQLSELEISNINNNIGILRDIRQKLSNVIKQINQNININFDEISTLVKVSENDSTKLINKINDELLKLEEPPSLTTNMRQFPEYEKWFDEIKTNFNELQLSNDKDIENYRRLLNKFMNYSRKLKLKKDKEEFSKMNTEQKLTDAIGIYMRFLKLDQINEYILRFNKFKNDLNTELSKLPNNGNEFKDDNKSYFNELNDIEIKNTQMINNINNIITDITKYNFDNLKELADNNTDIYKKLENLVTKINTKELFDKLKEISNKINKELNKIKSKISATNTSPLKTQSYYSALPVYEFTSTQIQEAWEKELSKPSQNKKLSYKRTEFDDYFDKLISVSI